MCLRGRWRRTCRDGPFVGCLPRYGKAYQSRNLEFRNPSCDFVFCRNGRQTQAAQLPKHRYMCFNSGIGEAAIRSTWTALATWRRFGVRMSFGPSYNRTRQLSLVNETAAHSAVKTSRRTPATPAPVARQPELLAVTPHATNHLRYEPYVHNKRLIPQGLCASSNGWTSEARENQMGGTAGVSAKAKC